MRMLSFSYASVVFVDFTSKVKGHQTQEGHQIILFQHRLHLGTKVFASWFVGVHQMLEQMQFVRCHMQAFSNHLLNGYWEHLMLTTSSSVWLSGPPLEDVTNSFQSFQLKVMG